MMERRVYLDLSGLRRFQSQVAAQLDGVSAGPIRDAFRQWAARYRSAMQLRFDTFSKGGGDWPPLKIETKLGRTRSVRRLNAALSRGEITQKQFDKRIGSATRSDRLARARIRGTEWFTAKHLNLQARRTAGRLSERDYIVRSRKLNALQNRAGQGKKNAGRVTILRDTGTLFNVLSPEFVGAPGQLEEQIPFGVTVGFGGPAIHPKGKATIAAIAAFHQDGGPRLPQRRILVEPDPALIELMAGDMTIALQRIMRNSRIGGTGK